MSVNYREEMNRQPRSTSLAERWLGKNAVVNPEVRFVLRGREMGIQDLLVAPQPRRFTPSIEMDKTRVIQNGVESLLADSDPEIESDLLPRHVRDMQKHLHHEARVRTKKNRSAKLSDIVTIDPPDLFIHDSPIARQGDEVMTLADILSPRRAESVGKPKFRADRATELPVGAEELFVDQNPDYGLDLRSGEFQEVHSYIDRRIGDFIIRSGVVNRELLRRKDFQKAFPHTHTVSQLRKLMLGTPFLQYRNKSGEYYLPHDDVRVNLQDQWGRVRFNWDSEENIAALLGSKMPNRFELAKRVLLNAEYLFQMLGWVPNASAIGFDSHTQPPRHTTMIKMIYEAMSQKERQKNKQYFEKMWQFAEAEYWTVFNAKDPQNKLSHDDPLHHTILVDGQLFRRYGSRDSVGGNGYHEETEKATGWDYSDRFEQRAADFSPIDLEMYLHDYERHFEEQARAAGDTMRAEFWQARQAATIARIMRYHLNPKDGYFYDYDIKNKRRGKVASLAGFLPFAVVEDPVLKQSMLKKLREEFLYPNGLALTTENTTPKKPTQQAVRHLEESVQGIIEFHYRDKQWRNPNQFYNVTSHVVDVLMRAGEYETAAEVMENALVGMVRYYKFHGGRLPEKLNVKSGEKGGGADYIDQDELTMPFGAFKKFTELLPAVYKKLGISKKIYDIFNMQVVRRVPLAA